MRAHGSWGIERAEILMSATDPLTEPSMEDILSSIRDAINDDPPPAALPQDTPAPHESPALQAAISNQEETDPFAAGSSAEAAFSAPPPGQRFDPSSHKAHDPFAELTRKLNETRQSVHKQMQAASAPSVPPEPEAAPEEAPPERSRPVLPAFFQDVPDRQEPPSATTSPAPALAQKIEQISGLAEAANKLVEPEREQPAAIDEEPVRDHRGDFSKIVANLSRRPPSYDKPLNSSSADRPVAPAAEPEQLQPFAASAEPDGLREPEFGAVAPSPSLAAVQQPADSKVVASVDELSDAALLDAVVRRMVEPAVKVWLNDNLSRIVTEVVHEEVSRVASKLK